MVGISFLSSVSVEGSSPSIISSTGSGSQMETTHAKVVGKFAIPNHTLTYN